MINMVDPVLRFIGCLLVFAVISEFGECARTSKKIYIKLDHVQGCFRRLNATHQIGCSSQIGGNVGVIHHIESDADLEWILQYGPHAPYIALMSSLNFNVTNVKRLKDSGKVNGILVSHVLSNDSVTPIPSGGFSPDHSCPLDAYGMYSNNSKYKNCKPVTWNPVGNSMMYEDFGIPIFVLLNETEVNSVIYDCYEKFNKPNPDGTARKYPLCAAELKGAMYAAKDSVTCIRRTNHVVNLNAEQYCEPLGDKNVFATVKEITNEETLPQDHVILAAARIDSFTLFEKVSPSADNDITGFVTLLAAAEALSRSGAKESIRNKTNAKDILFTFFQGEAFDYIGSSRMVYEMEKNRFPKAVDEDTHNKYLQPINLTHISHLVEVSQLGLGEKHVWIHTDPISRNDTQINTEVNDMLSKLEEIGNEHEIKAKAAGADQPLPPGSVQRFLRKRSIPTVLLTDHQKEFTNKFYNSRFDIAEEIQASYPENLNQSEWYDHVTPQAENLAVQAAMLAEFLYTLSTGDKQFIQPNATVVTHLLYCFLYNGSCDLFQTVVDKSDADKLEKIPYTFYVSVSRNTNRVSFLTKKLLAYFLGEKIAVNKSGECKAPDKDKYHQYLWMQGPMVENSTIKVGVCYRSTADFSQAKSPLFLDEMKDYDWASGEYSSWTESVWDALSVRMFLVPSQQFQTITLSTGVIIMLVSFVLVYFVSSNANIIFSQSGPSTYY